jgi:hypothetical protein
MPFLAIRVSLRWWCPADFASTIAFFGKFELWGSMRQTKIWCQHMPPNFMRKWFCSEILLHITFRSGCYALLETKRITLGPFGSALSLHALFYHRLHEHATILLLSHIPRPHGRTIGSQVLGLSSLDEHKYRPNLTKWSQVSTMPPSSLFFRALPTLLDPPWTIVSSWKPIVDRRILVISPESSHHQYEAVLVFARARKCGHLPLDRFAYAKKPAK